MLQPLIMQSKVVTQIEFHFFFQLSVQTDDDKNLDSEFKLEFYVTSKDPLALAYFMDFKISNNFGIKIKQIHHISQNMFISKNLIKSANRRVMWSFNRLSINTSDNFAINLQNIHDLHHRYL